MTDNSVRTEIIKQVNDVAQELGKRMVPLTDDLPLLESGLDSLCFAMIVAKLEDSLGIDPFSAAVANGEPFPVTFGDLIRLYENAPK